ncbi:DUF2946 family protein [Pararoseomonas indoligenes]|uniref:DUF2946 domain-containing protein n=1 Tax=Roseomonas indoligenes TaxID=2820811 RepID=A0A940MXJ4_9PROT|nr:DUF2946 family protein [Pararoseomonas indoligenes]MBP0492654.1 hypothetical protein [Pararoseomonas indoligenes]
MRLIALLLLMQWAGAAVPHARAMARAATAQAVELCTHGGRRLVVLDKDGRPLQPAQADDCCILCHGPLGPAAPGPAVATGAAANILPMAEPFRRPGLPALPPRAPPQQPRAPPHF